MIGEGCNVGNREDDLVGKVPQTVQDDSTVPSALTSSQILHVIAQYAKRDLMCRGDNKDPSNPH